MLNKEPSLTRRQAIYRSLAGVFLYISVASQRAEACFLDMSAQNPMPCFGIVPEFETPTATADGFTVQVSSYDSDFTWSVSTTAGSATISGTGLITVTELTPGESATATVITSRLNYTTNQTGVSGSAAAAPPKPVPSLPIWGVAALSGMLIILVKKLNKK
jgi:hypothetical protein